MSTTTPSQAIAWRALSAAELAAWPEARLGGVLAVMFWAAVAMLGLVALTLAYLIVISSFVETSMLQALFSGSGVSAQIARIQYIPQGIFAVWAVTFAVMTLTRRPSTPIAASALMAAWAASSIGSAIATRYIAAMGNFSLFSLSSLLPYIFLQIVLVAAFCGYMSEGRRANAYFRKRVRA